MSAVQALPTPKFLRKTTLRHTEANTNFKMLDNDIGEAITSAEADKVTPLMSKIYTRLLLTPDSMREGERTLRFAGEEREGKWVTAWEQLCSHLHVSSETANKALRWMHQQGIIGYYSGKNGAGIRIFLNRAASSIAKRTGTQHQKILSFDRASDGACRTSPSEAPFNDSYAVLESLESDVDPRAPKNGADRGRVDKTPSAPARVQADTLQPPAEQRRGERDQAFRRSDTPDTLSLEEIVFRLKSELEPALHTAARQAAAREHERTREWLEAKGLPKAARVAQREAYNVLRKYGVVKESAHSSQPGAGAYTPPRPQPLSEPEVAEFAEVCVAMLDVKGQAVEVTLAEMSVEGGGFLLPEDAPRVRERAASLLRGSSARDRK